MTSSRLDDSSFLFFFLSLSPSLARSRSLSLRARISASVCHATVDCVSTYPSCLSSPPMALSSHLSLPRVMPCSIPKRRRRRRHRAVLHRAGAAERRRRDVLLFPRRETHPRLPSLQDLALRVVDPRTQSPSLSSLPPVTLAAVPVLFFLAHRRPSCSHIRTCRPSPSRDTLVTLPRCLAGVHCRHGIQRVAAVHAAVRDGHRVRHCAACFRSVVTSARNPRAFLACHAVRACSRRSSTMRSVARGTSSGHDISGPTARRVRSR